MRVCMGVFALVGMFEFVEMHWVLCVIWAVH